MLSGGDRGGGKEERERERREVYLDILISFVKKDPFVILYRRKFKIDQCSQLDNCVVWQLAARLQARLHQLEVGEVIRQLRQVDSRIPPQERRKEAPPPRAGRQAGKRQPAGQSSAVGRPAARGRGSEGR